MAPRLTFDERIDKAIDALSKAAGAEVDRKAVAKKIEDAVVYAQFWLFTESGSAPRSDTRKLFKKALKQVQELRRTLESIVSIEHRYILASTQSDAYADLPTIHNEVEAIWENLPEEIRSEDPPTHLDVAARDFQQLEQELKRFDERWGAVVKVLEHLKDPEGRPRKEWKTQLIRELATIYEDFVGANPPISDRGPFVSLCKSVFEFLEPGKPHQAVGDTVKKALVQSNELVGN